MNTNQKTLKLVKMALIVAVYVAVTGVFAPISFGNIQFRISEILVLLIFVDGLYLVPLTLGCAISNFLFSTMGLVDVICGTGATFLALVMIYLTKEFMIKRDVKNIALILFASSVWAAIVNGVIVGAELYYVLQLPFWLSVIEVAAGEFVVVSIVGVMVFKYILSNERLKDKLMLG